MPAYPDKRSAELFAQLLHELAEAAVSDFPQAETIAILSGAEAGWSDRASLQVTFETDVPEHDDFDDDDDVTDDVDPVRTVTLLISVSKVAYS